jgi:murein endopeptidase
MRSLSAIGIPEWIGKMFDTSNCSRGRINDVGARLSQSQKPDRRHFTRVASHIRSYQNLGSYLLSGCMVGPESLPPQIFQFMRPGPKICYGPSRARDRGL